MNRYPLWKYLIMIVAVVIGLFYTVPNIFPQVPAVQVSTNKTAVRLDAPLLDRVEKTLKAAGVAITSSELDPVNGVHVRFAKGDSDSQVKAKELLLKDLNNGVADGTGNYIIALTSESTTPHWMQNLNGKPMALGLDLRGGVHFLMQVDMKGALDRAADRNAADIRSLMREKKIQYGGVDKSGETIAVKFSDPVQREKASREISDSNKDLLIKEDGAAQDLRLIITLKEEAKKKLADSAIEQNQKVLGNRINALGLTEPISRNLRIHWPDGLEAQAVTTGPATGKAQILLTRQDGELATVPAAAESWTYNDDATQLTFTLREGLKYGDGSPLNAERFAYSIRRNIDPATAGEYASITTDQKKKILGLNAAKMYDIPVPEELRLPEADDTAVGPRGADDLVGDPLAAEETGPEGHGLARQPGRVLRPDLHVVDEEAGRLVAPRRLEVELADHDLRGQPEDEAREAERRGRDDDGRPVQGDPPPRPRGDPHVLSPPRAVRPFARRATPRASDAADTRREILSHPVAGRNRTR